MPDRAMATSNREHTQNACRLCQRLLGASEEVVAESEHAVALAEERPRMPGHCIVVTRRHVASITELTREERRDAILLVRRMQRALTVAHRPDGMNAWVNHGALAGQVEPHVKFELVPRYEHRPYEFVPYGEVPLADAGERAAAARRVAAALDAPIWEAGTRLPYSFPLNDQCWFCDYVGGRLPWTPLFGSESSHAFLNVRQRSRGSTLVIPERHVPMLGQLTGEEVVDVFELANRTVEALTRSLGADAMHVFWVTGVVSHQSEPHAHVQVTPRFADEAYSFGPSEEIARLTDEQLRAMADTMRAGAPA
ncbi:MAG TPA: HIT family protein [Solirubrobacterales bacterium]|nr:HIT family protein [Solirubrobacterales bacterium]